MKKLNLTIVIHSKREKVWQTMLDPEGFKSWTAAFAEGSCFEGSWGRGEKIRFLTADGYGMASMIAENRPLEYISIKHLGIIKDGVEDTDSPESQSWVPAFENYTFRELKDATELQVDMDVAPQWEQYMKTAWPKALARLKEICER